jgi:hypothetical protein
MVSIQQEVVAVPDRQEDTLATPVRAIHREQ